MDDFDSIRIVGQVSARQLLGISPRTWDRLRASGEAPPHIQLSERRVGYRLVDLQKWLQGRGDQTAASAPHGRRRRHAEYAADEAAGGEAQGSQPSPMSHSPMQQLNLVGNRSTKGATMASVDDEQLALQFLDGCMVKESDGRISHRYLDGDEERKAQAALVRVLGNRDRKPSDNILSRLRALFDAAAADEPRKFVIKHRRRGPQSSPPDIVYQIAYEIAVERSNGSLVDDAITIVTQRCGVSRSTAYRAWEKHSTKWSRIKPSIWDSAVW